MTTYYYKNTITGLVSQNSDYSQPQVVTKADPSTTTGTEFFSSRISLGSGGTFRPIVNSTSTTTVSGIGIDAPKRAIITNLSSSAALLVNYYQRVHTFTGTAAFGSGSTFTIAGGTMSHGDITLTGDSGAFLGAVDPVLGQFTAEKMLYINLAKTGTTTRFYRAISIQDPSSDTVIGVVRDGSNIDFPGNGTATIDAYVRTTALVGVGGQLILNDMVVAPTSGEISPFDIREEDGGACDFELLMVG